MTLNYLVPWGNGILSGFDPDDACSTHAGTIGFVEAIKKN